MRILSTTFAGNLKSPQHSINIVCIHTAIDVDVLFGIVRHTIIGWLFSVPNSHENGFDFFFFRSLFFGHFFCCRSIMDLTSPKFSPEVVTTLDMLKISLTEADCTSSSNSNNSAKKGGPPSRPRDNRRWGLEDDDDDDL